MWQRNSRNPHSRANCWQTSHELPINSNHPYSPRFLFIRTLTIGRCAYPNNVWGCSRIMAYEMHFSWANPVPVSLRMSKCETEPAASFPTLISTPFQTQHSVLNIRYIRVLFFVTLVQENLMRLAGQAWKWFGYIPGGKNKFRTEKCTGNLWD